MKIIENSNIVNWDDYPEYICALVMQTTVDLQTRLGVIMPKGEEIITLLDKAPRPDGDILRISHTKMHTLTGCGLPSKGRVPCEIHELHFKPKPTLQIKQSNHETCEV